MTKGQPEVIRSTVWAKSLSQPATFTSGILHRVTSDLEVHQGRWHMDWKGGNYISPFHTSFLISKEFFASFSLTERPNKCDGTMLICQQMFRPGYYTCTSVFLSCHLDMMIAIIWSSNFWITPWVPMSSVRVGAEGETTISSPPGHFLSFRR